MRPSQWAPIATMPPATFADVMELNLQSAFVTTQAVAARLVAQGSGGSIVHIASISGQSAMPFGAPYAAAKAGMLALVRTAALELGGAGVRVNAVAAGTVSTAKTRAHNAPAETSPAERHLAESQFPERHSAEGTAIPLGRRGQPGDIAGAVLYLLSDLAGFVTGHTLVVDGGSSARPSYLDADNLPVFVDDPQLRARLLGDR
jgi:3-oxoacyl-[acyl-carrier protein] reductase